MMTSVEAMIEQYVAAWNEKTLQGYRVAFATCWAADATYTDPNYALVTGVDGLAALAHSSLEKMPSRTFSILNAPDYHHNVGRYTWQVALPEETRQGFDYFEFDEAHQLTRLVSFFGPLK